MSDQNWVDCVAQFTKALDGWVTGSNVTQHTEIYNLVAREHLFSLCFAKLHQHLVDSKLTCPKELAKAAELWVTTRVSKKVPTGESPKGGQNGPQQKKGGDKNRRQFPSKPQSQFPKKNNPAPTGLKREGDTDKRSWSMPSVPPKCYECGTLGHYNGNGRCAKECSDHTSSSVPGLVWPSGGGLDSPSLGERVEIFLVSLGDREMVPKNYK